MQRISLILLATFLAFALLALSYPRLRSSIAYLPVETALRNHWEIAPIQQGRFPALIEAARASIEILDDSHYWRGLAWLQYLYVESLGDDAVKEKDLLAETQYAFETFLLSSPAAPREWLRLAWLYSQFGYPVSKIVGAWRMSVQTGRAEHTLYLNRLKLGLRYANYLEEDDKALLRGQILLAWRYKPRELVKSMVADELDFKTISVLIYRDSPEVLAQMEEVYEKVREKTSARQ